MDNSPGLVDAEEQDKIPLSDSDHLLPQKINSVLSLNGRSSQQQYKIFQTPDILNEKEDCLKEPCGQTLPRSFTSDLRNGGNLKLERSKFREFKMENVKILCKLSDSLRKNPEDIDFLNSLEHLDISFTDLSSFPICISSLNNLKHLNISNNNISELPEQFTLDNLEYLNISKNSLKRLPNVISKLKHLTLLNLSCNDLSELPDSFNSTKLSILILSHNKFKNVPDCIINSLQFISNLDMSYNRIMFFDLAPKCVGKLIKLDLSNNLFHDIPPWLFSERCKLLYELNLSGNKHMIGVSQPSSYSKSGDTVGVSTSLKILKASHCCFSSSSVEFLYGLRALESLTLGNEDNTFEITLTSKNIGNILFNFPSRSLKTCTNLKYLNMNNVGLADLPQDLGNLLPKLENLDISCNQLTCLPESVCKLVTLKILRVSCNEVRNLPSDFGMLNTLEEIRLNGNKLQCLPDSFKKLKNIRIVDLYDNIFNDLPVVLLELPNLEACDIDFNLFGIDDLCEKKHAFFMKKYSVLKMNMRSLIAEEYTNCSRQDDKKIDTLEGNESEEGETPASYSYCEDISSDEFPEPQPTRTEECEQFNEVENWDASDDSDSHFDPTLIQRARTPASYGPSLLVYDVSNSNPEHFCPADIHSEPIKRGRTISIKPIAMGQFDDADM